MSTLANLTVAGAFLLAGVALALFVLAVVAARRVQHPRLRWVALAFLAFAAKGAYLLYQSYTHRGDIAAGGSMLPVLVAADLAILAALYFAVWAKP